MGKLPQSVKEYLASANVAMTVSNALADDVPLLRVNDAFCELTGYAPEDVEGRNCRFLQGNLRRQAAHPAMRAFFADPSARRVRVNLVNFRADGTPFVNMLTMTRMTASGGEVRYIAGTQFDITAAAPTELRDYEEELRELFVPRTEVNRDVFLGSAHSMAEAAAAILQARLLLEDADRAGLLL